MFQKLMFTAKERQRYKTFLETVGEKESSEPREWSHSEQPMRQGVGLRHQSDAVNDVVRALNTTTKKQPWFLSSSSAFDWLKSRAWNKVGVVSDAYTSKTCCECVDVWSEMLEVPKCYDVTTLKVWWIGMWMEQRTSFFLTNSIEALWGSRYWGWRVGWTDCFNWNEEGREVAESWEFVE